MEQENKNKTNNTKGANKDFPFTTLGVAEAVLLEVDKAGGKINTQALKTTLGIKGGAFARKLSAIKRWGLVSGQGMLVVTELGKGILHPISDEELAQTRKTAFLGVPLFSELYQRFKNNLPEDKTFIAILIREHEKKEDDAKTILNIYKNSIKEFLSLAGENNPTAVKEELKNAPAYMNYKPVMSNQEGKVSIFIRSPMGENSLKADDKIELKALKNKIEKLFSLIEDELPEVKQQERENEE